MRENSRGMLLVLSGPSGCGKGTLVRNLQEADPTFVFSISCTTRAIRPGEIPDVHYHYLTDERFDALIEQDAFLEYASVHGFRYGTLKQETEERLARGENVILDIDPQGGMNVMKKHPDCVSIFVLPPSFEVLEQRLRKRATESEEQVLLRLSNARKEVLCRGQYRYNLINDALEDAVRDLLAITRAEKHNTVRFFPEIN